jgi:hypothetical protein
MKSSRQIALLLLLLGTSAFAKTTIPERATWMQKGLYGITYQLTAEKVGATDVEGWNEVVDQFDVAAFAEQAEAAGASWVIFPLGGDSGFWCAPSIIMDKIISGRPSRCSTRDLPMELENALHQKGIKLILSMPSRAPQNDPVGMKALGDVDPFSPAPELFKIYWENAIREWSQRYGTRLSGWWFDQVHNWDSWEDPKSETNFDTWAAAAREGNANRILCFNSKKVSHYARLGKRKPEPLDFASGEQIAGFTKRPPDVDREIPPGAVGHKRIPLSGQWGGVGYPVQPASVIGDWLLALEEKKGALTIDVGVWSVDGHYGLLPPWQLDCLNRVKKQVKEGVLVPEIPSGMSDLSVTAKYFSSSLSRITPKDTPALLLTTGASGNGNAFITQRENRPYIVVSLAEKATVRQLDLYRSPASTWSETALAVWMWKSPDQPMTQKAAAYPENWTRLWQSERTGWQWILSMKDGLPVQHLKIGLEEDDVEFRLGRVKIYGDPAVKSDEALPDDWKARQEALKNQEAPKAKLKKRFGIF